MQAENFQGRGKAVERTGFAVMSGPLRRDQVPSTNQTLTVS